MNSHIPVPEGMAEITNIVGGADACRLAGRQIWRVFSATH